MKKIEKKTSKTVIPKKIVPTKRASKKVTSKQPAKHYKTIGIMSIATGLIGASLLIFAVTLNDPSDMASTQGPKVLSSVDGQMYSDYDKNIITNAYTDSSKGTKVSKSNPWANGSDSEKNFHIDLQYGQANSNVSIYPDWKPRTLSYLRGYCYKISAYYITGTGSNSSINYSQSDFDTVNGPSIGFGYSYDEANHARVYVSVLTGKYKNWILRKNCQIINDGDHNYDNSSTMFRGVSLF